MVVVVVLLSIHSSRHPSHSSKFLILEEEDDGRGGGRRMATTVVDSERSRLSARASEGALEWTSEGTLERWLLCSGSNGDKQGVAANLSFAMELKVFFFFFPLAFYWSFFPFLSLTGFFFCIFFYETPEWNFVSPNGVIARASFMCSGTRRSSNSWRRRKRRRPRLRRIFAAVELLHSSVTLLVDTSLEVKLKCTHVFFFLG